MTMNMNNVEERTRIMSFGYVGFLEGVFRTQSNIYVGAF